ncbi:MAG: RNA chaperone Hfq [Clostridia bacterium]|nr:RNA chaperone Hfq [Clostridia bacterium]
MKQTKQSLQDYVLNALRKSAMSASIIVTNGFQLNDVKVCAFDNFVVVVQNSDRQMMIYKHAISSIIPSGDLNLDFSEREQV